MVRADFPHDSYWKSAVVEFSDGSLVSIQITAEFQEFFFRSDRSRGFAFTIWFRRIRRGGAPSLRLRPGGMICHDAQQTS